MNPIDELARRAVVEALFNAVAERRPLTPAIRHAFGVLSGLHEQALREAVSAGQLERDAAIEAAYDRVALRRCLSGCTAEIELVFDTTLGHADQQHADTIGPRFDEPVAVDERGDLQIRVSNAVELWRATSTALLEPETLEWLANSVDADSVVYDVGANIGVLALHAWRLGPAQVVAFEPEPLNFARLVENIALNRATNMLALPIALSDRDEIGEFRHRDFVRGAASPHALESDASASAESSRVACVCRRLDDLRGDAKLRAPTHLKIDVDGHEPRVLAGAARSLADPTLRHILIELQRADRVAVFQLLAEASFRHVGGRTHGEGVGNYVFERW